MSNKERQQYGMLLLVRVSSAKQWQEGESPDYQISRGLEFAERRFGLVNEEVYILTEVYSGRSEERPELEKALEIIIKNKIPRCAFFDIDRFTRAGPAFYDLTKRRFREVGCEIVDVRHDNLELCPRSLEIMVNCQRRG